MGLLSNEVEISISGNRAKYFEDLGYEIPRRQDSRGRMVIPANTKIIVKVKDLTRGSKIPVDIQCDHCNKQYQIRYYQYLERVKDGKTYCTHCYGKVFKSKENSEWWDAEKSQENRDYANNKYRKLYGYDDFIKAVYTRDNYTCQCCGKFGCKLNAHHLNGYNWFEEGRTDVNNGVTLCDTCHKNFHSIYGNGDNTIEQYQEWIILAKKKLQTCERLDVARKIYCYEESKVYESVIEYVKSHNIHCKSHIYKMCNMNDMAVIKGHHLFWYDKFLLMSEKEIGDLLYNNKKLSNKDRPVICMNTNTVYQTSLLASEMLDVNIYGIFRCCNKVRQYTISKDKTKLQWMYYEDYLNDNNLTDLEARKSFFFIE